MRSVVALLTGLTWGLVAWAAPLAAATPDGAVVPFDTVGRGARSRVRQAAHAVARTPEEWARLWSRHAGPGASLPQIDFAAEMVVAVFAGERPTGGYALEITRVIARDGGLRVVYHERTPSAGAVVTQSLTAPFHVIRLPRSVRTVEVLREAE